MFCHRMTDNYSNEMLGDDTKVIYETDDDTWYKPSDDDIQVDNKVEQKFPDNDNNPVSNNDDNVSKSNNTQEINEDIQEEEEGDSQSSSEEDSQSSFEEDSEEDQRQVRRRWKRKRRRRRRSRSPTHRRPRRRRRRRRRSRSPSRQRSRTRKNVSEDKWRPRVIQNQNHNYTIPQQPTYFPHPPGRRPPRRPNHYHPRQQQITRPFKDRPAEKQLYNQRQQNRKPLFTKRKFEKFFSPKSLQQPLEDLERCVRDNPSAYHELLVAFKSLNNRYKYIQDHEDILQLDLPVIVMALSGSVQRTKGFRDIAEKYFEK